MSEVRPTPEQRDRCLDELAEAYARGRLSDAEFAERSDQVLNSDRVDLLESALAELRQRAYPSAPRRDDLVTAFDSPRPPRDVYASTARSRANPNRRNFLIFTGLVAFGFIASLAIVLGVGQRAYHEIPDSYQEPAANNLPVVDDFLGGDGDHLIHPLTTGAMSSITITREKVTIWGKPHGEGWQRVSVDAGGGTTKEPADPGGNIFDNNEFLLGIVPEIVKRSPEILRSNAAVSRVELVREQPKLPARYLVVLADRGVVVWDAVNPVVIDVRPPA